jgi:H+/Cl- antiporter ClcA
MHPKTKTPSLLLLQKMAFWHQIGRWLMLLLLVGGLVGSASALFLSSLAAATATRSLYPWLIYMLPLGGLLIGWGYQRYGRVVEAGTTLLIAEYHQGGRPIPLRMAPMVLVGTLLTHVLGGSAGREGTAVQMGGAIADQFTKPFQLSAQERRILLLCGIAAGFASVFGTPWAGGVFAIEVMRHKEWPRMAVLPVFIAAWLAHLVCLAWGVGNAQYVIGTLPPVNFATLAWLSLASVAFGAAAWLFVQLGHWQTRQYQKWVPNALLRPALGGTLLAAIYFFTQNDRYLGLGLPVIAQSFEGGVLPYDFLLKILFTTFTLAVGFKGGEVTPLFFVGATLGASLSLWLPIDSAFLAAMGLVAVFAAATKCPIACIFLGMELFGLSAMPFVLASCLLAVLFSGSSSIYRPAKASF